MEPQTEQKRYSKSLNQNGELSIDERVRFYGKLKKADLRNELIYIHNLKLCLPKWPEASKDHAENRLNENEKIILSLLML